jgi:histone H3/H4
VSDILVVSSKVKTFAKKFDLRTSGDFVEALSKLVEQRIEEATVKARAEGRKTLLVKDL